MTTPAPSVPLTLLDWGLLIGVVLLVVLVLGSIIHKVRADRAKARLNPGFGPTAPNPFRPMGSSDPPQTLSEKKTPRELRTDEIRARLHTGFCLYCTDAADAPLPMCRPVRPFFERILRWLGATPRTQWTVQVHRESGTPRAVCERHHEQLIGLFEGAIAEERVASAKFEAEQRLNLFTFEMYGADETMRAAMQTVRAWKPSTSRVNGTSLNGTAPSFSTGESIPPSRTNGNGKSVSS